MIFLSFFLRLNNESDILEITIDRYNNEKDSYEKFDKKLSILSEKVRMKY